MSAVSKRQILLPVLVIMAAILVTFLMVSQRETPAKKAVDTRLNQVNAIALHTETLQIPLASQGVVEARTRIRLLPEVSGRIVEVADHWVNGGYVRKGEVMLRIEDHSYRNQLARAKASLAQANSVLTQEKALAYVAKKDWEKRSDHADDNQAGRSLALREPQLASAQAQLSAAEADVASAEILLEKTRIRAPFDGIISNKAVDIGQVISPGQLLAEFDAIDIAEVRVPLTQRQQSLLDLPGLAASKPVDAELLYHTASGVFRYPGQLVRTEAILDDVTKVLYGVIRIADPYQLDGSQLPPLPLGAFVEIDIVSRPLAGIVRLPQRLLRPGNRIWVADIDNRLQQRTVTLLPVRGDTIYVESGLLPQDRIIVSSVVDAHEGNPVDVLMDGKAEP